MDIVALTRKVEQLATDRPFGQLQMIRERLKGKRGLGPKIFRPQTVFRKSEKGHDWSYAFHFGGRREMQFNFGFEDDGETLRYGVAFSFQGSRNFGSLDLLRPSVRRFNRFIEKNPAYLTRFAMWHYEKGRNCSPRGPVRPVPDGLIKWGVFVFVGSIQPARERSIDYGRLLNDLDWLIPLYEFVEGKDRDLTVSQQKSDFEFKSGCSIDTFSASALLTGKAIEINFRQRRIQKALHEYLISQFGRKNVGTEQPNLNRRVDLAVRNNGKLWYYEVKTSQSVQQCIREALGQLLEYSYWPGLREAEKLIVVGEKAATSVSRKYISILEKRFSIPIEYQQFDLSTGKLVSR